MTIQFIVEDGTGKTDATSYATVEEYKQFCDNYGKSYTDQSDDEIKAALNYATLYIDTNYRFIGQKTDEENALEWPRAYNTQRYYEAFPSDIVKAACSLAAETFNTSLYENKTGVKSEQYGPVSVTYGGNTQTVFTEGNNFLKKYIISGNGMVRVN